MISKLGHIEENGSIQLDADMLQLLRLGAGEPVLIQAQAGHLIIAPVPEAEADDSWFGAEEWQAGEREADEDIRLGRFVRHQSSGDFVASLQARMDERADT